MLVADIVRVLVAILACPKLLLMLLRATLCIFLARENIVLNVVCLVTDPTEHTFEVIATHRTRRWVMICVLPVVTLHIWGAKILVFLPLHCLILLRR